VRKRTVLYLDNVTEIKYIGSKADVFTPDMNLVAVITE
jgi:hypothetical protein